MTPGGTLAAEVVLRDGIVSEARIVSTRRVPLGSALRGKRIEEAVALVPLLFATCGIAHALAASSAVESASGVVADAPLEGRRARTWARQLLVATEVTDGHLWSILVDWPQVLGEPPRTERLRALRGATAALRDAVDPSRISLGVGGGRLQTSAERLTDARAQLDALVADVVGELPDDVRDLERWARRSSSPAAPLVGELLATSTASVGASDIAPLPELDAGWFAARLATDARFGERPTVDGAPREAGPLARAADQPLVASVIGRYGRGTLARVVARLGELASATARVRALALGGEATELAASGGCGVADTARGRLAHWALVEEGRVVDWRFVAPTEWTFHPDGAFPRGLLGVPALEAARAIRLHVAALDPCVPCAVTLRDGASEEVI